MSDRREVNVERSEHSWIPFYRELAEKLVNDGWRERQEELVELMREMARDDSYGVPEGVARSRDPFMDPFSLFGAFNNTSKGEKRLLPIIRVRDFFGLSSRILHADFLTPEVNSQQVLFWSGVDGYRDDVMKHWKLFEFVMEKGPFDDETDADEFVRLMDASLNVTNVGMGKLSSAFYWLKPYDFLEYKTINGIVGEEIIKWNDDAASYLNGLARAKTTDYRPFPEVNDYVYLRDHSPVRRPNVWCVRGGRDEHAVDQFLTRNRVGVGFGLGGVDLSVFSNRREIESAYREANPDANNLRVGQNAGQIKNFIVDMKVGDYVMMPVGEHIRYGAVTSRPYHDPDVIYENSRAIAWYEEAIPRKSLSGHPLRRTVSEVKDQMLDEFWSWARPSSLPEFKMPEDSWVPFHLEVGKRLVEGEWWLEEKRGDLIALIQRLREADPAGTTEVNQTFDPFNFYQAFSQRDFGDTREGCFEILKDGLSLASDIPDLSTRIWSIPSSRRIRTVLSPDELQSFWDMLRAAIEMDPANDPECRVEFAEIFNRVHQAGDRPEWRRVLSTWLYLIAPTKYIHIHRLSSLGILRELGLDYHAVNDDVDSGTGYVRALVRASELARAAGLDLLRLNSVSTTRGMLYPDEAPSLGGSEPYTLDHMLDDGVFLERGDSERMVRILRSKRNLILQGPPGVGKTFIARKLAYVLMGSKAEKRVTSVQFHQSYSYEDFVGGFRPDVVDEQIVFTRQNGPFLKMCAEAKADPDVEYVMLIDEINRGNLSRVFGELLMLIEADKRKAEFAVKLQHRPDDVEGFFVPENVYIIGTMNLADRSLTGMNVAMRRRFGFVDMKPQFNERVFTDWLSDETEMPPDMQARINTRMTALNSTIANDASLGFNYAVGHSFFCPPEGEPAGGWEEWYETVVDYEIRPLLREYWFDAPDKANEQADTLL